ncbi:hypothetical protein NSK_007900 [Nannochloropsis salina CCMP1776]|uniref:NADH dehydrogenase [ubiquinone] iron-sulfur protein 5 n=1 Tax=Nannochloropsis salina CCMP1776 TaxID=1027361 RepID=A0A4D9CT58_9STRA|nr:hypothetical protein NSK_007900 [Nannochloropsis salina CCMP1776]|eukprot:TFJ80723.1 hypothetical protein NSK_007900 [Nannochloropsis salina CCMP1776]
MSSGFGVKGNVGRCYPFWSAFEKCLATADHFKECMDFRDDYEECLHHRKEYARVRAIEKQRALMERGEEGGAGGHVDGH